MIHPITKVGDDLLWDEVFDKYYRAVRIDEVRYWVAKEGLLTPEQAEHLHLVRDTGGFFSLDMDDGVLLPEEMAKKKDAIVQVYMRLLKEKTKIT